MFTGKSYDFDLLAKSSDPSLVNHNLHQLVKSYNRHNLESYQPLNPSIKQLQEQNGFQNNGYSLYHPGSSMVIARDD